MTENKKHDREDTTEKTGQRRHDREDTTEKTRQRRQDREDTTEKTQQRRHDREDTTEKTRQRRHDREDTTEKTRQRRHDREDTTEKTRQRRHDREDTTEKTRQRRHDREDTTEKKETNISIHNRRSTRNQQRSSLPLLVLAERRPSLQWRSQTETRHYTDCCLPGTGRTGSGGQLQEDNARIQTPSHMTKCGDDWTRWVGVVTMVI